MAAEATVRLKIKPLLTNEAWQGRRFSTAAKKQFEKTMALLLPKVAVKRNPYYRVEYHFHLRYFAITDYDGCIKVMQDCLVKRGIIEDDRFIIDARIRKFPALHDQIEIFVEGTDLPAGVSHTL